MSSTKIRTFTGRLIDLAEVLPSDIDIYDIAHALARICRFGGHVAWFYSVAQHSMRVSRRCSKKLRLEGLLHDAAEAYIGDLVRPLKYMRGIDEVIKPLEVSIERAIALQFGLTYPWPSEIKTADDEALRIEQATFWDGTTDSITGQLRDKAAIHPLDRLDRVRIEDAEQSFLTVFHELRRDRDAAAKARSADGTASRES